VKNQTLIILFVFCSMLCLQTVCAAGISLHCLQPEKGEHQHQSCDEQDQCRKEYSAPQTIKSNTDIDSQPGIILVVLAVDICTPTWSDIDQKDLPPPLIPAHPAGQFPLLI